MRRKRTWIIVGIVVVLIAGGVILITNNQRSAAEAAARANVQLGRVTRATLLSTVDSSGSVTPESKVTLSFGTSGPVSKVNVQAGDQVKKGDVLAELDTSSLQLQIAQQQQSFLSQQAAYSMTVQPDPDAVKGAQLALNNAAESYRLAQQKYAVNQSAQVLIACNNLDNVKQSYDDAVTAYNNYISNWRVQVNGTADISPQKARLDSAKAAYDQALANCNLTESNVSDNTSVLSAFAQLQQAKANLDNLVSPSANTIALAKIQLDQARMSLEQAQRQLEKAKIVAPFDGVVTAVSAVVGADGGSATIVEADNASLNVGVLVDETQIGQVKPGQAVQVTFDGLLGTTITGTVGNIYPAGTVSQGVVNYFVNVDLQPTTATLKLDMSANTRIILDTHANVLAVPGAAVRTDANGYYVNVVDQSGNPTRVDVATGYTDGDLTEVSGNLQPGERVYLSEPPSIQQQNRGPNLFGVRVGGG
jgi:HlyD family secretion protein